MEDQTQQSIVCPECRATTSFNYVGDVHKYTVQPVSPENLPDLYKKENTIVLSEFHKDHTLCVILDKSQEDSDLYLSDKITSDLQNRISTLITKLLETYNSGNPYRILILSDLEKWNEFLRYLFTNLLLKDQGLEYQTRFSTNKLSTELIFQAFSISLNPPFLEKDESKYNVIIADQKYLAVDNNLDIILNKMAIKGKFVVTVNAEIEEAIPIIAMDKVQKFLTEFKLNFLFLDIHSSEQIGTLLIQSLQN
ncbi:MAG: hypothetical protein ACXAD7_27035 [Candidatus Kariarchaeaceae archaeon]